MSLMRLLAAGRSIMGIRKQPGPYRMTQENLLPKFAPPPRPGAPAKRPQPASGPATKGEAAASAAPTTAASSEPSQRPPPARNGKSGARSLFVRLVNPFSHPARKSGFEPPPQGKPVQAELSLDSLKVVRNDLTDCDFEVIPAARIGPASGGAKPGGGTDRRALGMVWNRLSARLLRQAALDFTLVQKERGKLLSQAGHGGGGPGGS